MRQLARTPSQNGGKSENPILIPRIDYLTNDSWEDAAAIDGSMGWPMLHEADYSKGHLFVVTIPRRRAGWAPSDAGKSSFRPELKPHSFRAFRAD